MAAVVLLPSGPTPAPPGPVPVPAGAGQIALADIERALGQRVGPFADLLAQQGLAPTQIQVDALRSSAETAGWENLFVLRRGVYSPLIALGTVPVPGVPPGTLPGDPIPGFDVRDRVRLIKDFAASSGSLEVDRDYVVPVAAGERLELHVLHPEWELRPAVLQGLERTFLFDRIPLAPYVPPPPPPAIPPAALLPGELTSAYPWLTDRSCVWGVEWGAPSDPFVDPSLSSGMLGTPVRGWDALQTATGVQLILSGGLTGPRWFGQAPYLWVLVRRPGWSVVNGVEWTPEHVWADDDGLVVPLPYAVAAAHVAAWDVARTRLLPGAAAGMALTENDCGRRLTRQTARWFRPDVRPPEDRYPVATRFLLPGGRSGPHWGPHTRSGASGWIANA